MIVTLPLPGSDGVAEDGFEQRAKGELTIVAVGEQDHAVAMAGEADHIVLCAFAVTFFEEGWTEARMGQKSPADAVGETDCRTLGSFGLIEGGELAHSVDANDGRKHGVE